MVYPSSMQRIQIAEQKEKKALLKSYRRAEMDYPSPALSEDALSRSIDEGRVLLLHDGSKIYSFLSYSPFPFDVLFPNDERSQNDFLETLGYRGEPLLLLEGIYTDPLYQRKGYASLLLASFLQQKRSAICFAKIPLDREAILPFFLKAGYSPTVFSSEGQPIYCWKKKKEGLCSDPSF